MNIITKQDFDSKIFGVDYYRIQSSDIERIKKELAAVKVINPVMIDTKIAASEKELDRYLQSEDFRKVCMQIELECFPVDADDSGFPKHIVITDHIELDDKLIQEHSENFLYDRFSLDCRIEKSKRDLLYSTWVKNSLLDKNILKAHIGSNFVSFRQQGEIIKLDLSSVLEKGIGVGSSLLKRIKWYAKQNGKKRILVVTECENVDAVRFYMANGFRLVGFYSCFHFSSF